MRRFKVNNSAERGQFSNQNQGNVRETLRFREE
jgi:hypothetical protein